MSFRVAIGQIRPSKADYSANLARVGEVLAQAAALDPPASVLVLPETALTGYFLEGGVREVARTRHQVFDDLQRAYASVTSSVRRDMDVVVGFYELLDGKYYNAAMYATLGDGDGAGIVHVHHKFFLPTYGVFDEKRFVARGRTFGVFGTRQGPAAVLICEDVWHSITATLAALKGAQILYVLSASPARDFSGQEVGSVARWDRLLPSIADEHSVFVVYAGLVGFEGGKGFSGSSTVVDPWGRHLVRGSLTEECLVTAMVELDDVAIARAASPLLADLESAASDLALELESVVRAPHVS